MKGLRLKMPVVVCFISVLLALGCGGGSSPDSLTCYTLDTDSKGCAETIDNIRNVSIVSIDSNVFKAEYEAGFLQGRLQKDVLIPVRDNTWDAAYLDSPSHTFPKQIPPSPTEIGKTEEVLLKNYNYTINYMKSTNDALVAGNLQRILFRLIGIYHGATLDTPRPLDFSRGSVPSFLPGELKLGYETPFLTFIDVYFINSANDVFDVMDTLAGESLGGREKCSAFVKRTSNEIYIAHNNWNDYLNMTGSLSLYVNGDYLTVNTISPGMVVSNTDFGYNNKGIMFNETTHKATYTEPKTEALWMFVRAALAEQFSSSLDEFYRYVSLEASGTYMNGFAIVDTKTREIGLVEMSYKNFIYFRSDGRGEYIIKTKPDGISKSYDAEILQSDFIMGINYPASYQIAEDVQAINNTPARKRQFLAMQNTVKDIETSKYLITYRDDPANPLSIYGRFDLGYGETPYPKTVPHGAVDAKVASASMTDYVWSLKGVLNAGSQKKAFWMKYGTAYISGKPFIWSESQWKGQKLRGVPDRQDGSFVLLNTYIE